MGFLSKLKIIAQPARNALSPEQARMNKLIAKLDEQMRLAEAEPNGTLYERKRARSGDGLWLREAVRRARDDL